MHELIASFLDNNSPFGKMMTRLGIIIGANLMFVLFSIPIVTIGASYAALYHVMLKTLRGDGVLNPFKQFWKGFKGNFKQATIVWIIAIVLGILFYMEFRITGMMTGDMAKIMRAALIGVAVVALALVLYLFPVMAAFADTLPHLTRNSIFFAVKNPLKMLVILAAHVVPIYLYITLTDWMPLFAFIWMFFGFGAIVMLGASLLLPLFKPFLPAVDGAGNFIVEETTPAAETAIAKETTSAAGAAIAEETTPAAAPEEKDPTASVVMEDHSQGEQTNVAPEKKDSEILDEMKKLGM